MEERLEWLLDAIAMPGEMREALLCLARGEAAEELPPGTEELYAHLTEALREREDGVWRDLPEDVFVATMGAFTRFVREHLRSWGRVGFDRAFWTTRQVHARLLRVGEMEYELRGEEGDPRISLHIPSNTVLRAELLNRSVDGARALFARFYPEWADAPILLHSWLLSPALPQLLPEGSNILRFQSAFDILETEQESDDCLEWVFKIAGGQRESVRLEDLPENTSLQRSMKAYLLAGGGVGSGRGVLARPFA